jgi:phosphoribosyl-ATP pyrophosphohydrolase/phosphoribosyl-AMP cyclohydrolase
MSATGMREFRDFDPDALAWDKQDGLLPAIVQDARSGKVLMLGYMSRAALRDTLDSGWVTFYSRSKKRLWTKGESSGHRLRLAAIEADCDADALLVQAEPLGPTCHLGRASCFALAPEDTLAELEALIDRRWTERPAGSYTTKLFDEGIKRVAQKVGEEGLETALAAVVEDDAALLGEASDLIYHLLVLLKMRGLSFDDVKRELTQRRG